MLRSHFCNLPILPEPKDIDIAITALLEAIEGAN